MIERILYDEIRKNLEKQKVGLLLGARRVGKTNLLRRIKENFTGRCLWLNGEDENVAAILEERTIANYKRLLDGVLLLIIDEAQYINDIGRKVKGRKGSPDEGRNRKVFTPGVSVTMRPRRSCPRQFAVRGGAEGASEPAGGAALSSATGGASF